MKNIKEKLDYYENELKSKKLCFSYVYTLFGIEDVQNNFFSNLLSKYDEIEKILNLKEENIFKFFYFNRIKIHNILYDNEEVIEVDNTINKNIILYFYLDLLIKFDLSIVDYTYSLDLITKLNESQKESNNKKYKKIINSKIIIDLINNYKGYYKYEEKDNEILDKIESDNKKIIKENVHCLTEIGLNFQQKDIISKKIDEIYVEIIISLIKSKKFDEKTENIVKELDLENIDITIKMFDKISEILDSDKYYIINNKLEKAEDLYDEKKINFYYILFKYILKNSIYIYKNFSLMKSRKALLKIIKNNDFKNGIKDCNFKDRIKEVIEFFTDTKYYYETYINSNNNINNEELDSINDIKNKKETKSLTKDNTNQTYSNPLSSLKENKINRGSSMLVSDDILPQKGKKIVKIII